MDMNTRHLESEAKALSGEVFGAMINLSGRRRFTSQRIVLYAVLGVLIDLAVRILERLAMPWRSTVVAR